MKPTTNKTARTNSNRDVPWVSPQELDTFERSILRRKLLLKALKKVVEFGIHLEKNNPGRLKRYTVRLISRCIKYIIEGFSHYSIALILPHIM